MRRGLGPAQDVSSLNLAAPPREPPPFTGMPVKLWCPVGGNVRGQGYQTSVLSGLGSFLGIATRNRGVLGHALGPLPPPGTTRRVGTDLVLRLQRDAAPGMGTVVNPCRVPVHRQAGVRHLRPKTAPAQRRRPVVPRRLLQAKTLWAKPPARQQHLHIRFGLPVLPHRLMHVHVRHHAVRHERRPHILAGQRNRLLLCQLAR